MKDCLKVLLVASEAAPFIKSGGLGDVAGSLPKALRAQGVDVRVVIPRYMTVKDKEMYGVEYLGEFPGSSAVADTAGESFGKAR